MEDLVVAVKEGALGVWEVVQIGLDRLLEV